jgi:alkylation response protein AidB-like acyl-CoA dehydrogenase
VTVVDEVPSLLYTQDQQDLRAAVRELLRIEAPWSETLEGVDRPDPDGSPLWTRLADELGCVGVAVGEELGGAGGSWSDAAVVMEELGRAVAPTPFLSSAVLATALLQGVGGQECDALLRRVAEEAAVAAVVVPMTSHGRGASSYVSSADGLLTGEVPMVAGVLEADVVLVPVDSGLFVVDRADVAVTPVLTLDMTRRLADVSLRDVAGTRLADPEATTTALGHALAVGASMLASEQLGVAEWCLDTTVIYLRDRRQFGRSLASYQALKHRLADLWTAITQARAVARYAAAVASSATPDHPGDLAVASSLAHVVCSRVAQRAAEECVQLHGGIGFTWEHPAQLYLKRARASAMTFGTPSYHRGGLGRLAGLDRTSD